MHEMSKICNLGIKGAILVFGHPGKVPKMIRIQICLLWNKTSFEFDKLKSFFCCYLRLRLRRLTPQMLGYLIINGGHFGFSRDMSKVGF